MKRIFCLSLVIVNCAFSIFAKQVALSFDMSDGTKEIIQIDDSTERYELSDSNFSTQKEIISVSGFENLENLEILYISYLPYYGNWDFLEKIPNLKNITLSSCWISSFNFLENLRNIESISITNFYCDENNYENLKNEKVNLCNLNKLEKLQIFSSSFYVPDYSKPKNQWKSKKLDFVPNFINVQNKPNLYLDWNQISMLSKKEIKSLSQYYFVDFSGNPILKNEKEVAKIKKANINIETKKEATKKTSDKENETNLTASTDYNFLLMITNDLEVGYDNKNVYLTEISTGIQIVFICDDKGMYSRPDLLDSFKYAANVWAARDAASVERWATRLPRWHIQDSFQHQKEFDKHFNKELDKYYVNYRDVYTVYHT